MDNLEERFRKFTEFTTQITSTIDKNDHEKCSAIGKIIHEQQDVRRLVEELARRLDHTKEHVGETQNESSVAIQLEISDLKAKVLRLTERHTEHEGKVNFFSGMSEQVAYRNSKFIDGGIEYLICLCRH